MLFFQVVPVPPGRAYIVVHVSHNGSDTSHCGTSGTSACFSLLHVLHLYFAKPPKIGLQIKTDKSLHIDESLMVCLLGFQSGSCFVCLFLYLTLSLLFQEQCASFASSRVFFDSEHRNLNRNISIIVSNSNFKPSVWSAAHVNVLFSNCDMTFVNITVYGGPPSHDIYLHVYSSHLGSEIYMYNSTAIFEKCTSASIPVYSGSIWAMNSTIIMKSSNIEGFQGENFLRSVNSTIHFIKVRFVQCSSRDQLIGIYVSSWLHVENCVFQNNYHSLINIESSSSAVITESLFVNNTVPANEKAITMVRNINSGLLWLTNSNFSSNSVFYGTIGIINTSYCVIENSDFTNNKGGAIYMDKSFNSVIKGCIFYRNSALFGGTVAIRGSLHPNVTLERQNNCRILDQNKDDLHIKIKINEFMQLSETPQHNICNCKFVENTAQGGGAVYAGNVSILLFKNSFVSNSYNRHANSLVPGFGHGGALLLVQSPAEITQCIFDRNIALQGGGMYSTGDTITIKSSVFKNNKAVELRESSGGAIHFSRFSKTAHDLLLWIANSSFYRNEASRIAGAINSVGDVVTKITTSTFSENKVDAGGAMKCKFGYISNSTFRGNTAHKMGGALYLITGSKFNISHSTFANNTADRGGAIFALHTARFYCHTCSFYNNTSGRNIGFW